VGPENSMGALFNVNNGGIFALEKTDDFIKLWFFSSKNIPDNISKNNPNSSTWGRPYAYY